MNSENKFKYLSSWCEAYHAKSGLKVHPSSVPVDVVLDELMGEHITLVQNIASAVDVMKDMAARISELEARFTKIEDILLNQAAEAVKATKKVKK